LNLEDSFKHFTRDEYLCKFYTDLLARDVRFKELWTVVKQNAQNAENCACAEWQHLSDKIRLVQHYQHQFLLLHFAWVVDDTKCIVVTRVCVSVCVCVCLCVCPRPYTHTTARTRM